MEDKSGEEVIGDYEQRFTKMEIQVTDISHNMPILMTTLKSMFGPSCDFGGSKLEMRSEGKS